MKDYFPRKERIVISAIDIIDEMGLHELSLRELARRQGISDAALYRHYESKEAIILAVLDYYSRYDEHIAESVLNRGMPPGEGILFFVNSIVEAYESYPALTSIVYSLEVLTREDAAVSKVKDIFRFRSGFIIRLVEQGQEQGSITDKISCEDLADMILGVKRVVTLKWRMEKYGFSLKQRIISAVEALLGFC